MAIGDGANDVSMITAAHVGIGIKGLEGNQAAKASDYSIGEFKMLRKLVLYYGRENYRRNAYLILYNFYKNFIMIVPKWWYGMLTGWQGQAVWDPYLFQMFNIFYTFLPIIVYAVGD